MSKIVTITFCPCIDKSTTVPVFIPEKKLKCSSPKLEPGGGGINVARAIKKLGGTATAIYAAGGYTGRFFNKLIADEGVPAIIIETGNETRENIIVREECTNQQYRFGMPGSELKESEWRQFLDNIERMEDIKFLVASGSLPPGVPVDIFARMALMAKKRDIKFIADTSGEALKFAAREGLYLLKPNLGELASLVGKDYLEPEEVCLAAREIIENGDCEVVVVSMGAGGAMLITKKEVKNFITPRVKGKSTVGAGDSMVAGIVLQLSRGKTLEDSVRYGVACGTAATINEGTELCRLEDVERLFPTIVVNTINSAKVNA